MAALPTDFLKQVVAEVAQLKGIADANGIVKESDATVAACARLAYTQVCKKVRRPFHYGMRTEYYDNYTGPLLLRSTPVDREKPLRVLEDGTELQKDEIKLSKNKLILRGNTKDDSGIVSLSNVEVISYAGIKTCEENLTLFTAVHLQTIANYHRRDTFGLSQTSGEKGIAKTPADSGDVIASVEALLDDLIYMGIGYSMDGD
jgi:hypothetical protein